MDDSWLHSALAHGREHGLGERWLRLLLAFGGPPRTGEALSLRRIEAGLHHPPIAAVLTGEVDAAQAEMFARRFRSVVALLTSIGNERSRILFVGLVSRVHQILQEPGPRALRVRAAVDFYYSHGALVLHRDAGGPSIDALVQAATPRRVADGVQHLRIAGTSAAGPLHVNALVVPGTADGRRTVRTLDTRGRGGLARVVAEEGALAGTSGGFFLYSEHDIVAPSQRGDPVGLLVEDGQVKNPPVFARSSLVQREGVGIERIGLAGWTANGTAIEAVNAPAPVAAFNRAFGPEAPTDGLQVVGDRVVGHGRAIPLAGCVLTGVRTADRVRWEPVRTLHAALAGGPALLGPDALSLAAEQFAHSAPPVTFSRDETYDQNLLPRMAAGLRPDGTLVFVAVDGRNIHQAPGMTLRGTARLLHLLGCTRAMNLDGGSSKRMVVEGEVVDLPSTEVVAGQATVPRIRPVHTAVLIH